MRKWPNEVVDWLRMNVPGRTTKEVTALINQQGFDRKYGMVFTEMLVKGAKDRYGIKSGTSYGIQKGMPTKLFPIEIRNYIFDNYHGVGPKEMATSLNRLYGTSYTHKQIRAYYRNHSLNSGLNGRFQKGNIPANKGKKMSSEVYEKCKATMFKKGNVPSNRMNIGEYTHTTDGYLIRKIRETGTQRERFEFVHRAEWEKHNGPIPKGKMVSFLDGNKDNCDISNLVLLDNSENLELSRSKLRFDNPELTKAGVAVVKLKVAVARRKKGKKSEDMERSKKN